MSTDPAKNVQGNPNTRLRELVNEAGWNGAQFAFAVRSAAQRQGIVLGCNRSVVTRWLAGTQPRPPAPTYILQALSQKLGRPLTAQEAGLTRSPAPHELPWETDAMRRVFQLTGADLDPARRHLLAARPYTLEIVPQYFLLQPATPGRTPTAGEGTAVAQMQTMAVCFADAAERHGGRHVRTALAAYLHHDVTAWLGTRLPETAHRAILGGAAQLTLLLGTMTADTGLDALAQQYHRAAVDLAAEAADALTHAIALRTMAAHAYDLGHHATAIVDLAEHAAAEAKTAPAAVRAYTQAHLAVALARHDRRAALASLDEAERLHGQADNRPGPFTAYPLGALLYQRAQTLQALGDLSNAVDAYRASLQARGEGEQHARTLTHSRLAETLLSLGHLDGALHHWQAFADTYPAIHSARTTRRLTVMRQVLSPHQRHHGVRALLADTAPLR
ncbi:hypothetical protein ACTVZO_37740 [Streptomyces sp. IBSNAI002]|uniref:hypothetical protein n=1 Tax=Streptomyces sp. IBSNAI002 TaxID=3457500 RepID=UPI003FD15C6F